MKFHLKLRLLVLLSCLLNATACEPKATKKPTFTTKTVQPAKANLPTGETAPLTIVGFNYTDKDINDFYVDGTGGGNLYVSSASGGGGGSVCCSSYTTGSFAPEINQRWQSDACPYGARVAEDAGVFNDIHSFYTVETVKINASVPMQLKRSISALAKRVFMMYCKA